ncbi:hypothetical protein BH09SUM1_BH09SUM1_18230 [soil metagenome]
MEWQSIYENTAQTCYLFATLGAAVLAIQGVIQRPGLLEIFRLPAGARDAALFVGVCLCSLALLTLSAAFEDHIAGPLAMLMLTTCALGVLAFPIYPIAIAQDLQRERFNFPWGRVLALGVLGFVWSAVAVRLAMTLLSAEMKENFTFRDVSARYPLEFASIFFFTLIAAALEEILFRGGIQTMLSRWINPHAAIAVTALLWAFGHTGYMTPIGAKEAQIFGLGLLFGYARQKYGLRAAIVMHVVNNALSVLAMLLPWDLLGG